MPETVYSVSQLNRAAKNLLAQHFLTLKVAGEISNLSAPSSGHIYFTLKDAQAQVRCAMFRSQMLRLSFKPANGQQIIATAQVSLYEPRGDYQLVVEQLEAAGDGLLRIAFENLKQKLLQEGLFEASRKQALPVLPNQIGVITSPTGAAIHDILTVLKRRFPAIPVIIYPVAVQGESAKTEIAKAIATANQQALVDVLIVGRGGGSLEDLWAFNEEIVARAIAASKIPIISAVGHEVDFTIADFVADVRAPTPSVAAEYTVPSQEAWLNRYKSLEQQLGQLIRRKIDSQQQQLLWLEKALHQQQPGEKLQRNAQRLDELEQRINQAMQYKLQHCQQQLTIAQQQLQICQPSQRINSYQQRLAYLQQRLQQAIQVKLQRLQGQLAANSQTLHAVSPLATLQRGYAIVQRLDNQQVVKSSQSLKLDDVLINRFASGQVISTVKEIQHD